MGTCTGRVRSKIEYVLYGNKKADNKRNKNTLKSRDGF